MSEQKPILTSIDLTDYSKESLLYASQIAKIMGRKLIILHVIHDPEGQPGFYSQPDENMHVKPMELAAKEMMTTYLARVAEISGDDSILTAERILSPGLPFDQIMTTIESCDPEMLVLGSHGRKSLSKLLVGSVVDQLVKSALVPVTIVKTAEYLELIKKE